jgi:CIC family chloride channel protein
MMVAVIAFTTARRFAAHGLYDGWLALRGEHIGHGVDQSVMDRTHVSDALDRNVTPVPPDASIDDLVSAAATTRHGVLPVVSDDGALVGVVTHHALRAALVARNELGALVVAADLAEPTDPLALKDSLRRALAAMNARGLDALPVIQTGATGESFVGLLSRHDVLVAYEQTIARAV